MTGTDIEPAESLRRLNHQARFAAYLDAQGLSLKEIGEHAGMNPKSISRLRADPRYQQAFDEYREAGLVVLQPIIEKLRFDVASAYQTAILKVLEMLGAEDPDGNPIWSVRIKGVELLNSSPVMKAMFDTRAQTTEGSVAVSRSVSLTVLHKEDGTTETYEISREEIDSAEDADFEEVRDDADREAVVGGDDHTGSDADGSGGDDPAGTGGGTGEADG